MHPDRAPLLLLLALIPATIGPAAAEQAASNSQQPIQIEADRAEITDQSGVSVYSGNVNLTQGDLEMEGERLEIRRNGNDGDIHALLTGNPARLSQPTEQGEKVNARAQRIEYHSRDRSIDLRGNAEFVRGRDRVSGQNIRYDANARKLQASGPGGSGNRVQIIIQPGNQRNTQE